VEPEDKSDPRTSYEKKWEEQVTWFIEQVWRVADIYFSTLISATG
jgi:hypothetical protein